MKQYEIAPRALTSSSRGYQEISLDCKLLTENREIFFIGPVNKESANKLITELIFLEREAPGKDITLYIDSPGGDVAAGMACCDVMNLISSPIRTVCFSAYSMGAIMFLCGSERVCMPSGKLMIHDPSFSGDISVGGMKPHELKVLYDDLCKCKELLVKIISEKTNKAEEIIAEITKNDAYYNAEESVEFGLATKIAEKGVLF